ncbi:hypothetical protein [Escherichia coli]
MLSIYIIYKLIALNNT